MPVPGGITWIVTVAVLLTSAATQARPAHKKALADYLGPFLATKLNDCRTCHLPDPSDRKADPVAENEKPHNPFGQRLRDVRKERRKAGLPSGLIDALEAIAEEDSDRDGVPNLVYLADATGTEGARMPARSSARARTPARALNAVPPASRAKAAEPRKPAASDGGEGKPFYKRGWFFAALGVVLVGGAVGVWAATRNPTHVPGTPLGNQGTGWQ